MYLTHNESNSVVADRFIRTFKGKIYKIMTANNSKAYLSYLNKLEDENNKTYDRFIGKRSIHDDHSALNDGIASSYEIPKLTSIRTFSEEVIPKIGQKKYLLLILC